MIKFLFLSVMPITMMLTACNTKVPTEPVKQLNTKVASPDKPITAGLLSGLYRDAGVNSPVILIVPGSGPTDLNGNNSLSGESNVYIQMAEALAADGISTIRVDKRGMFSSEAAGDPNAVTLEIYAQDYRNWVDVIRAETNQSCVYMLGHSEGALMVSAASIDNANVCGLILVSAPGRPLGDVLREQLKANPANKPIIKEAFSAISSLEQGKKVDTSKLHRALRPLFNAEIQDFLISVMAVDPAQVAADAKKNTLVIQGMTDLQTSTLDAQKLADATNGHLVAIEGVNHILKEAPINRRKNLATYKNPDLPISQSVIEAIRIFVTQ